MAVNPNIRCEPFGADQQLPSTTLPLPVGYPAGRMPVSGAAGAIDNRMLLWLLVAILVLLAYGILRR